MPSETFVGVPAPVTRRATEASDAFVPTTPRRARLEIAAVVATGLVFLFFENVLHQKLLFLVPCVLAWAAYVFVRARRAPSELRRWGLRLDNLGRASRAAAPFFVLALAGLVGYRLLLGWRPFPPGVLLLLLLYPVWGLLQQFVVQGLVTGNLRSLGVPPAVIVPVAALLFGLAHVPDLLLAGLCFAAGLVWTVLFLRVPNVLPLALSHAWLGTLAYLWVLERDPWREMFPG